MFLKRLELRGFKTFASYTDLVFDAGITAIVGPNGSGKSNIADAVRWVLGEQSYAALRGKRTEDMIFAGTSRRPQMGMAEAILTFDNSSRWLPIDFAEVTVCRRAYRSGENQYLVNGSRVRLRDVLDMLGKASLGRQGFVVIGQGLVDAALTLRPEERRVLFEVAAGIHIYQDKRTDSLNKLAETKQNTLRLNDITAELAPRVRDLEHQARRAQEHEAVSRDLEKLLRVWYGYQWHRLQLRVNEAENALHSQQEELDLWRGKQHEVEALVGGTLERQAELRRQLSLWHKESGELHSRAELTGRELAVSRERLNLLQVRQSELSLEAGQLESRRARLQAILATAQTDLESTQTQLAAETARVDGLKVAFKQTEAARIQRSQAVDQARDGAYALASSLAEAKNKLASLQERRMQVVAEHDKAQQDVATVEAQLAELRSSLAQAHEQSEATRAAATEIEQRRARLQKELADGERDVESRRQAVEAAARSRQRAEDRQELLSGLRSSMAGLAPGVKAVLEARQRLSGIIGPVTELLQVPPELERAIESALGTYGQALVVERWEDASGAIAELRRQDSGWATFLPLDSLSPSPTKLPPGDSEVIGLAQQLVTYETRFERVAQLLLGQVVVVKDLEAARRIRTRLQPGQRIVTLTGETVQSTGVLSGGSARRDGGRLAQERELRELPVQVAALRAEEERLAGALGEAERELAACREGLNAAAEELRQIAQRRDAATKAAATTEGRIERLLSESEWRRKLSHDQHQELQALETRATELNAQIRSLSEQHTVQRQQLDRAQAAQQEEQHRDQESRQAIAEAETSLAVLRRQSQALEQSLLAQRAELERFEKDAASSAQRMAQAGYEAEQISQRVATLQIESTELSTQVAALSALIDPAEAELNGLENQVQGLENELAGIRRRASELDTLFGQQLLEKERRVDAFASLERRIEEDLGDIEYPTERVKQLRLEFLGQQVPLTESEVVQEDLSSEIKDLKARLRRMGTVNPNAPQEFAEVSQRYQYLKSQIADLEQSAASLEQVIKELDEVMKTEFLKVFHAVAAEFSRYFQVLFQGGQARIALTDPDNPSTTGVEIFARPPGKRQQSLALLSGGERALTAAALVFAVLKTRPLPFCFLDEVDAMLDEANVGRFRSQLLEFSELTQFIVITHNRQTVEAANTIYGISMGEDGASKTISLRLQESLPMPPPAAQAEPTPPAA
ncbi:MAG TPA: chromosome segregation protein SMC [Anaerolineae bacterium]|nr:chromosome segregation protein SMC [Anaerolineae bacterium]